MELAYSSPTVDSTLVGNIEKPIDDVILTVNVVVAVNVVYALLWAYPTWLN